MCNQTTITTRFPRFLLARFDRLVIFIYLFFVGQCGRASYYSVGRFRHTPPLEILLAWQWGHLAHTLRSLKFLSTLNVLNLVKKIVTMKNTCLCPHTYMGR